MQCRSEQKEKAATIKRTNAVVVQAIGEPRRSSHKSRRLKKKMKNKRKELALACAAFYPGSWGFGTTERARKCLCLGKDDGREEKSAG
jgi:hypothetical protein